MIQKKITIPANSFFGKGKGVRNEVAAKIVSEEVSGVVPDGTGSCAKTIFSWVWHRSCRSVGGRRLKPFECGARTGVFEFVIKM